MNVPRPRVLEDHSPLSLRDILREDWERHSRSLAMPGLQALALHRVAVWGARQPLLVRFFVRAVTGSLNLLVIRNVYGIEIARTTVIGRRLRIGHHQGVVLGGHSVIGDDCLVRQNVTLGQSNDEGRGDDQPRVGNGVQFGAGATVIGPVRIGNGARIGPGAIVTTHVPAGTTAFAAPARLLKPASPGPRESVPGRD